MKIILMRTYEDYLDANFILYTKWCQFQSINSIIINSPEAWLKTLFTRILLGVRSRCI